MHAEVVAGDHNAVGNFGNFLVVLNGVAVLELGEDLEVIAFVA